MKWVKIEDLVGKILKSVDVDHDMITLTTEDDEVYRMYHSQSCCESVTVEDVCGNVEDLIGHPLLLAEEVIHHNGDEDAPPVRNGWVDSCTWTFYKLGTVKGTVTIRWYGESNGYYSETVDLVQL